MLSKTFTEVENGRRKRIHASSTALSLWLCLLAFQAVRFAWLLILLRTDGIVDYIMYTVGFSLVLDAMIFRWVVAKHGFVATGDSPFAMAPNLTSTASWNPLRWNMHAMASAVAYLLVGIPAMWYLMFLQPGRLLMDGPYIGPMALSELRLPTDAGAIEFKDGHAHHGLGGGVEYTVARTDPKIFYADPFGDDSWDPSQPVQVWVVHEEGEEITAAHRYAYLITKQNVHRVAYQLAVKNSHERFQTRSADHAIMVHLDTRPPAWPNGPSYLQVLGALYLASALYVACYVRRLALFEAH
ncbi:MAG: hypothetical protein IT422_07025 [Pirellulaceae bacterium]|jgi:hypothetical protein|nr:hypothetical protein [Pirellulaceae bacterium]